MKSEGYALLLAAVFCALATAMEVNEAVLEEGANGTSVVLLSVAHIRQATIFSDDKDLLRRIAYVETRDGSGSDSEGGIWAVSKAAFENTKNTSSALLAQKHEQILRQFSIVWQSVQFSDLRRPLYSALAARLVLFIAPQTIPNEANVTGQAQFWRANYNINGSVDAFIGAARKLQGDFVENDVSDVYVGFIRNDISTIGASNLQLFVSTQEPDPVTFTVDTLLGFSFTGVATRDSTTVVSLSISYQVLNSSERNKGIHVSAGDKQIVVYGLNYYEFSADAFLALPCSRLPVDQYEYYAITYHNAFESQLLFVGCEDNTTVTFASNTITLNQMETYLYERDLDITGIRVVSNKPISVFSGHRCATIGQGTCDHIVEQLPPTATWETSFLSASFSSKMSGEIYRIVTSQPSTTVTVNCTTYTQPETYSLAPAGAWQEFMTPDDSFCVIESNKPLLVVEFALGSSSDNEGPFMMMLPPVQQYSNNYTFNAPAEFTRNFITIFVPPEYFEPENIFVDDISQEQTNWIAIYCLDRTVCGYAAYASLETGDHHLYHSDPQAMIGMSAYGFVFGNSYGYPGNLQVVHLQLMTVSFSQETYFVGENEKTLNVSVVRSGNTTPCIVVLVASDPTNSSATAGQDYSTVIEILELLPGVTEKEVEIRIFDDMSSESNETFVLYLSSGAGVFLSPYAQAEVTIINRDVEIEINPTINPTDASNDLVIIIGISVAAAVVALVIGGGSITAGIICYRCHYKHKEKHNIPATAYEDNTTAAQSTVSYEDTINISVAHNVTYEEGISVSQNTAYEYVGQGNLVSHNTSTGNAYYEDVGHDIPASHNDAYEGIEDINNTVYEEI